MNQTYWEQYSNRNMLTLLITPLNIPLLEKAIDDEEAKFLNLEQQRLEGKLVKDGKLNLQVVIDTPTQYEQEIITEALTQGKKDELTIAIFDNAHLELIQIQSDSFNKVKEDVERFLQTPNMPECTFYFNPEIIDAHDKHQALAFYIPVLKRITLSALPRAVLLPVVAHEYTHHIQTVCGAVSNDRRIFMEGHARGVEGYIAQAYSLQENPAFNYLFTIMRYGELYATYTQICETFGEQKRKKHVANKICPPNLLQTIKQKITALLKPFKKLDILPAQAYGSAFFYLHEKAFGPEIYRDMIHERYDLEKKTRELWGKFGEVK